MGGLKAALNVSYKRTATAHKIAIFIIIIIIIILYLKNRHIHQRHLCEPLNSLSVVGYHSPSMSQGLRFKVE